MVIEIDSYKQLRQVYKVNFYNRYIKNWLPADVDYKEHLSLIAHNSFSGSFQNIFQFIDSNF